MCKTMLTRCNKLRARLMQGRLLRGGALINTVIYAGALGNPTIRSAIVVLRFILRLHYSGYSRTGDIVIYISWLNVCTFPDTLCCTLRNTTQWKPKPIEWLYTMHYRLTVYWRTRRCLRRTAYTKSPASCFSCKELNDNTNIKTPAITKKTTYRLRV